MYGYEFKESDWKLFRDRIVDWQENYMEKLIGEYISLLSEKTEPSTRFWALDERMKEDKEKKGVVIQKSRSRMVYDMMALLDEGAICIKDLEGFSKELQDHLIAYVSPADRPE